MGLTRCAACDHAVTAQLTHGLTAGAAFSGRDEAVLVGIELSEAPLGAGLDIGDHDRAPGLSPDHGVMAANPAAVTMHPTRAAVGAGIARGLTGGVKLAAADGAVIIGVETVKAGVGAAGPAGLQGCAALIGRDRTIPIGICGRQALKALADELGLAEAAIAIGIGTHGAGRSLLGGRSTGRGQQKRGEAAGE